MINITSSINMMLLLVIQKRVMFLFLIKSRNSRFTSSKISWVEADLSNVVSVQQPAQKPLKTKTIPEGQED